jgi:hypothetical protein
VSSWVCESDVKYWTEKNVEKQREDVTIDTKEKRRRWDTFNFRNLARACGTKMIVEYRLSMLTPWHLLDVGEGVFYEKEVRSQRKIEG